MKSNFTLRYFLCIAIAGLLSACAMPPTTPPAVVAPATVGQFADMTFKPLPLDTPTTVALTKDSPVFAFKEGMGYAAAFQLPAATSKRYIRFESPTNGAVTPQNTKVMIPRFVFLDADKAYIDDGYGETLVSSSSSSHGQWSSTVSIPDEARYAIVRPSRWTKEPLIFTSRRGYAVELPLANTGTTILKLTTTAVAVIADSGRAESGTKAQLFVVESVDGQGVENALRETSRRSAGQGFHVNVALYSREIPARKVKLTLLGTHKAGAPIHEIVGKMSGAFQSVRGTVDFEPAPDGRYVVKGILKSDESSVWVEDAQSGERVTQIVTGK